MKFKIFGDTLDGIGADEHLNKWLEKNEKVVIKKTMFACNCDSGGNNYHTYSIQYTGKAVDVVRKRKKVTGNKKVKAAKAEEVELERNGLVL